jgi:hypothetical protein
MFPERRNEMPRASTTGFLGNSVDALSGRWFRIESILQAKGYLGGVIFGLIRGLYRHGPERSMERCDNMRAHPIRPTLALVENLEFRVRTIKDEIAEIEHRLEKLTHI